MMSHRFEQYVRCGVLCGGLEGKYGLSILEFELHPKQCDSRIHALNYRTTTVFSIQLLSPYHYIPGAV